MTNADNCCCVNPDTTVMAEILSQDMAVFVRWGQVIQAFGEQATGSLSSSNVSCTSERTVLLAAILAQRQANFDRLQEVILAA